VLVPPAMRLILDTPGNAIQAFLAAGHVCTIMGYEEYIPIAEEYRIPIVITGFEPVDILQSIYFAIRQLEEGRHEVENAYSRVVTREGNKAAKQLLQEVFTTIDRKWRGIGTIAKSGYSLREEFHRFDAEKIFPLQEIKKEENKLCMAGEILQGKKKPFDCKAFGRECTPDHPLGAPMVSAEGACSAYYRYKKQ
jgi:hydrogenase expression/formation protein HypD